MTGITVANLALVSAAILSSGPGDQKDVTMGEWPLILDKDSWFCFLITMLAGAARAGVRFQDLPSRGNFPLNTKEASLNLADDIEVPATQTEMVKRLLKQIYAQLDERNDVSALEERVKHVQQTALDHFKWLVRARVAMKCLFMSNYFPEGELKEIMECILLESPKVDNWIKQIQQREKAELAKAQNEAYHICLQQAQERGREQAEHVLAVPSDQHFTRDLETCTRERMAQFDQEVAWMEEDLEARFTSHKREREMFFNHLDKEEQICVIHKEALALGIIDHEELQAPATKKVRLSRSSSTVSVRKRGRSASRSEDIEHINLVSYSSSPSTKTKDDNVTPTKVSVRGRTFSTIQKVPPALCMDVDVPIITTPTPISSDITPPPPAPAAYILVVNDPTTSGSSLRGLKSSIHGPGNQMDTKPTSLTTDKGKDSTEDIVHKSPRILKPGFPKSKII